MKHWLGVLPDALVNTLLKSEFKDFRDEKIKEADQKQVKNQEMNMHVLPEFKELFEEVDSVSSKLQYRIEYF